MWYVPCRIPYLDRRHWRFVRSSRYVRETYPGVPCFQISLFRVFYVTISVRGTKWTMNGLRDVVRVGPLTSVGWRSWVDGRRPNSTGQGVNRGGTPGRPLTGVKRTGLLPSLTDTRHPPKPHWTVSETVLSGLVFSSPSRNEISLDDPVTKGLLDVKEDRRSWGWVWRGVSLLVLPGMVRQGYTETKPLTKELPEKSVGIPVSVPQVVWYRICPLSCFS